MIEYPKPLLGFAAFSGTGKTTLLTQLLPELRERGFRIGMIKHAHHKFDVDTPGKDSYELRKSGASPMLIASSQRTVLMMDKPQPAEPELGELLQMMDPDQVDAVLVEGFKHVAFPKIELHRASLGHPLMCVSDSSIIALAADTAVELRTDIPVLDLNRIDQITEFVINRIKPAS